MIATLLALGLYWASPARAELKVKVEESSIGLTTDITWASKYMIDGFKVGGNHAVLEPSASFDLFSTGTSLMFWSALQVNRENRLYDELDLMARYSHRFFAGSFYAVNLHGFYDYWYYPKAEVIQDDFGNFLTLPKRQGNKLHAGVSLPELFPLLGSYLVPSYNAYYTLYWAQNQRDQFQGGAHHELLLAYYHDLPTLIPGASAQYFGVAGSLNYNDGAFKVHPGWSHSTAQLTTGVYALGSVFAASLNRQWSHELSVDPENELWTTVSFTKRF